MAVPSIIRCVRASDFVPYARVGENIIIQGSGLIEPDIIIDSESATDILINSESATDIIVDSLGL